VHVADRRAGDDPADPRARRRDPAPLRPVEAARGAGLRLGAARAAFGPLDGPVRRQPLQPLRLDRGRVGDDRDAGGPARRPRHRRQAAATTTATRSAPGRPAASSSATTSRSRATRAAATRTRSRACSRPATSATSTRAGGCSSTAATTT
jgi:hypothetical protein